MKQNMIMTMQGELNQFERNNGWTLVPRSKDHHIIGTKWVFQNKVNEQEIIIRNKARLVDKGHNQEERIDLYEILAPVVRLEAISFLDCLCML